MKKATKKTAKVSTRKAAALKAWDTRRKLAAKRSEAARKAWKTRRAQ